MRNIALVLTLATVAPLLAQSSSHYRITHTYTLGGDGAWDYIVPRSPNHRLFIGRQNRVMVVDENSGTLLGEVTGIQGAHGTAVANETGHGFATSGNDQSVVMLISRPSRGCDPEPPTRIFRQRSSFRQHMETSTHYRDRAALGRAGHEYSARRQPEERNGGCQRNLRSHAIVEIGQAGAPRERRWPSTLMAPTGPHWCREWRAKVVATARSSGVDGAAFRCGHDHACDLALWKAQC